jgi:hypothetical protein
VFCMVPFVGNGWRRAGRGLFLACLRVLGLDWDFHGLRKTPAKAMENRLGGTELKSGLILGSFLRVSL